MTISTTTLRITANGNGSTTTFPYTWKVFAQTELTVIVRTTASGAESVRAIGTGSTNYSVTGVGETSGGNVVFVTAPTDAETVTIIRNSDLTQGTDYQPATNFPAASHEDALDKLTHIVQELDEELDRSFKVSRSTTITTPELVDDATSRSDKYLKFASDGQSLAVDDGTVGSISDATDVDITSPADNSALIYDTSSSKWVDEAGATLRTSIGVGTGDSPQFTAVELGHASDTTIARSGSGDITIEGNAVYRAGGTDVPVADGGTGASSLTDGGVLLGSGTGAITAMAVLADGEMVVGDGTTDPVAESGATLRTSIGVGTGDSPQFTGIELGHATDTTIARSGSGDITIEGNAVYRAGGTDVPVSDGGTGASSLTDGGVLLGSGTGAITAMAVLADGEVIVGDGTTDPVAESGATLRTSIGVGTGDSPQFTGIELGHASDTTIARASSGDITIEGNAVYRAGGTDVAVADGGTGASTLGDGHVLLGSGSSAITALDVTAKGSILVGDGSGDPRALAVGSNDKILTADSSEASGLKWADAASGGLSAASQANMESASSNTVAATPGRLNFSPHAVKCAAGWEMAAVGTTTLAVNLASVTDTGTGDNLAVWDDDFSSTDYVCVGTIHAGSASRVCNVDARATGNCRFTSRNESGTLTDSTLFYVMAMGDQ